jgi:hypothetical protein
MIVCGHSGVEPVEGGWKVLIDDKVGQSLSLFPGQNMFGSGEEGSRRFFLSPIRLTPHVTYFRLFLEDVRGSLASVTELFSSKGVNILSGGAFGFGNIWVSEFVADFQGVEADPEAIREEMEGMGGFVTTREITELFPRSIELNETFQVTGDDGLHLIFSELPEGIGEGAHAVLKAWPRMQALFLDFYPQGEKLVKITAMLKDVPGSLNKLTELMGTQVDLHAVDSIHHEKDSGVWTNYGLMKLGSLGELREKAGQLSTVFSFAVEPLGWVE